MLAAMPDPNPELIRWAERTLGRAARVAGWDALKLKETQKTWLLRVDDGSVASRAILKTSPLGWYAGVIAEAAALTFAEEQELPAPRLLGVDLDGQTGVLAVLSTVLPGTSDLPATVPRHRLRALGAAAARLHAIRVSPRPGLSHHARPVAYDPYIDERREGSAPTTALLDRAAHLVSEVAVPSTDTVLVHGDYHLANTMWVDDTFIGYIDWDTAGVGQPGVDLGWSRLDAALHYSPQAADEILRGWIDAFGSEPHLLAYWDAVAALQTFADIGKFTRSRDDFLRSALQRMDHI